MAVDASEEMSKTTPFRESSIGQDAHSVAVLPEVSIAIPQCESQLEFLSLFEVSDSMKSHMCLDSQSKGQKRTHAKMDNVDDYAPSVLDVDVEKGKVETPKSGDEAVGNMKTEDFFTKALQREISFQIGGKFMQLLMNHSLELPKFTSRDKCLGERFHDTPTHRSRKYKRSASFNSRKVVLLFSVLSIMGTMILIYLTLRVRQLSDVAANV